jgi:hypothetical protein
MINNYGMVPLLDIFSTGMYTATAGNRQFSLEQMKLRYYRCFDGQRSVRALASITACTGKVVGMLQVQVLYAATDSILAAILKQRSASKMDNSNCYKAEL